MSASLTYPSRGWAQVRFNLRDAELCDIPVQALHDIPGVRIAHDNVMAHWTTWQLPLVRQLFDNLLGARPAQAPQVPGTAYERIAAAHLYDHQRDAVGWLLERPGSILGDEMGLGKTRSAIVAAEMWCAGDTRPRVIIAPKFTRAVWLRELLATGAITDPERQWQALEGRDTKVPFNRDATWYFVHYDVVRAWWSYILARRPLVAIADEAHYLKGPKTQRSKGAAMVLGTTPYRILLTGTPLVNRPQELWHLLTLAGGQRSFGTLHAFRERYCGMIHDGWHYVDTQPSNVAEFRERLTEIFLQRRIDEIPGLDIPALSRNVCEVTFPLVAEEAHTRALKGVQPETIYDALISGNASVETLRLLSELRKITSAAKMQTTTDYAVNAVDQLSSVVVFCWERTTVHLLAARIAHQARSGPRVYEITGDLGQEKRDQLVAEFQSTGGALVATIDALGVGVTLTAAHLVVLHDLDWTPSKLLQAEARVRRIGQHQPCVSTWMVVKNSIDTLFARLLTRKAHDADALLGMSQGAEAVTETGLDAISDAAFQRDVERMCGGG